MIITQTVDIPADHRLTIDVPREVPAGRAILTFTPASDQRSEAKPNKERDGFDAALEKIRELCKDAPISVDSFLAMRRQETKIEESRYRQFLSGFENSN